ncbi:MAG: replication-relaxation family protein [Planctomycetota bacterium]
MAIVITKKNLLVLNTLAQYYVLTRKMIQEMCFPHVRSSRSVCERLRKLKNEGYISQVNMRVVLDGQSASPVYHPNKKTAETLAAFHDDDRYLNIFTHPPSTRLLFHWIEIAKTHYVVDRAVESSDLIQMPTWYNEWEVINKDVPNKKIHYTIHSVLRKQPSVTCQPDAAFLLSCGSARKVFYVEVDRGTDSIRRIASKKPPGYAMMETQERFIKHFPQTNLKSFSVLFLTTTEYRRDELLKRAKDIDGKHLWKFATRREVDSDSFFFKPVWHAVDTDRHSLIDA